MHFYCRMFGAVSKKIITITKDANVGPATYASKNYTSYGRAYRYVFVN